MQEPRPVSTVLTATQRRLLTSIFELGARGASQALSQWLARPVHLEVSAVEQVEMTEALELLGPGETLVAACAMGLAGALSGLLLLVFEDRAGLALADFVLRQPLGTAQAWGELEESVALETMNISGCAYANMLASHLPPPRSAEIVPSPPVFRHEFAASLLEFALLDQAVESDRLLLVRSQFTLEGARLEWTLLLVPGAGSLEELVAALDGR